MKRTLLAIALGFGIASIAAADEPAALTPPPPPPSMEEPGVKSVAPPADTAAPAKESTASTPPPDDAPEVTVRDEGEDRIEEYRTGGRVTMIRIVPKNGIPQTYIDSDGDGRLEGDPKEGPVKPVYYTLYQWNK